MKINIASYGGRNWLLDTAKELSELGHEVKFYSFYPTRKAIKLGLKKECSRSYFIIAIPFLILLKITNRAHWSLFIYHYFFDHFTAWISSPCDIFIGQSPMHVYSLKYAKKKYSAKIIVERGTRHVLEQVKALATNPALNGKNPMPDIFLKRDLKGYQIADYITIPSHIVEESFIKNKINKSKLFVNPFGVNLKEFRPTTLTLINPYDLIIVGQWSHRKGCDLLITVCRKYGFNLLHVGSIIDVEFPQESCFTHIEPVEQNKLIDFYAKARVFVLPSREEGLALVQPQALVCGLPIVCSKYTGGRDLRKFINDPKWIVEMKDLSVESLVESIYQALEISAEQVGCRSYGGKELEKHLSWFSYGKRYNDFLKSLFI